MTDRKNDEKVLEELLADFVAAQVEFPDPEDLSIPELALIRRMMDNENLDNNLFSYVLMMRKYGANTHEAIDSIVETMEVISDRVNELTVRMNLLTEAHENMANMFLDDVPKH